MREILEERKVLQNRERRCVPNLRGASPVIHDGGGCSYAAQTVSRSGLGPAAPRARGVLSAEGQ